MIHTSTGYWDGKLMEIGMDIPETGEYGVIFQRIIWAHWIPHYSKDEERRMKKIPLKDRCSDQFECSHCHEITQVKSIITQDEMTEKLEYDYCPHCGAKMWENRGNEDLE